MLLVNRKIQKIIPIEGQWPCQTDKLCDPTFGENWENLTKALNRSLCMFKLYFNELHWNNRQEKYVGKIIQDLHTNLAKKNKEKCSYQWKTGE